jgi:hypothetical protein
MSGFVAFGSRWISLAERSHSSFAPVVFLVCVQVRILLLPVMPMRAVSGRSSPMQAGFPTGTHRRRSFDEAHSLLGRRVCASHEGKPLPQNSVLSLEVLFWLHLL